MSKGDDDHRSLWNSEVLHLVGSYSGWPSETPRQIRRRMDGTAAFSPC